MLKQNMSMMTGMRKDMKKTMKEVEEAKDIAKQAKYTASMAEQAVEAVKGEMSSMKEDLPKMVTDIVKGAATPTPRPNGQPLYIFLGARKQVDSALKGGLVLLCFLFGDRLEAPQKSSLRSHRRGGD